MKSLLLTSLVLFSVSAFADHHESDSKPFEEVKRMMLEGTELRISQLQAAKTCMEAAKDKPALKQCHKDLKAKRKEMQSQRKAQKMSRKEKREHKKK